MRRPTPWAMPRSPRSMPAETTWTRPRVVTLFLALALLALPFADLSLGNHDAGAALARMLSGFLRPDFSAVEEIGRAIWLTIAFAVAGVAAGASAGLVLAPFYHLRAVRWLCIALRSVHGVCAATAVDAPPPAFSGATESDAAEILDVASVVSQYAQYASSSRYIFRCRHFANR